MEFTQIASLLVVAGIFGIAAKLLKQPLLVGYLFAGVVLGIFGIVSDLEVFSVMGKLGVTLLLFLLGLEMNIREFPSIGKAAIVTAAGQILFTSTLGFVLAHLFGFSLLPSLYIAIALTFSSTIIMVKLLSEKKDLNSLYGKIAVGLLLVQDFFAILIIMFLSGLSRTNLGLSEYIFIGVKAIFFLIAVWILSKKVLPSLFEKVIGGSPEIIFITSIAWAFGIAAFVEGPLGFTLEIGGFLAGLALSNLPEHLQIAAKTRPLRDFFLTIFFLLLGAQLTLDAGIASILFPALVFSFFVLIGNPIIVLIVLGILGYRKRTAFMAGLTVAQISEFSLILMTTGKSLGHVSQNEVSLVVTVGVITMTLSTYAILGADKLYSKIKNYLSIFERKITKESIYIEQKDAKNHIVLVGCDRTGKSLTAFFMRKNIDFLVVDFNPKIVRRLTAEKIPVVFGDINDTDILEAANIDEASMVISTISNYSDDITLLEHIRSLKPRPTTIFTAQTKYDAIKLYENGADYVVVPEIVAGDFIRHLFEIPGMGKNRLVKMGKKHFNRLLIK